jgi:hypothetical protein
MQVRRAGDAAGDLDLVLAKQGSRRRRDARHPRRGRGRHLAGRRRRAVARCRATQARQDSGEDGSIVVGKILEHETYGYGFDAQTGEFGNLVSKGIIDPTKVVCIAQQDGGQTL